MMKKLMTLLSFVIVTTTVIAQKADIIFKEIDVNFELPTYLKNIKTYSYEIQDDGEYWNYTPSSEHYPIEEFPNLVSLTDGVTINGLELVEKEADLQILAGFLGNQQTVNNALISMNGTFSILILTKENKLIHTHIKDITLNQVADPEKFPMSNRDERNQTKARMLTIYAQKYLNEVEYLFKENTKQKLPFGLFKKTKGGVAEDFNTESKALIEAITKTPSDHEVLDKAITYWKSQIETDFGKKVKDKVKNKVLYVNLTTASILKNDIENTDKYYKIAKEYSGFFDSWTVDYTNLFKKQDNLKTIRTQKLFSIPKFPNSVYYITLDGGGTYTYKDKETVFSKIEIERFVPNKKSGIGSLNSAIKPRIFIYEDGVKTLRHFSSDHNKIITNDGKEIMFKNVKGVFKPFIKQTDDTYSLYQAN